ncbi:putative HNHc nuclease [Candidatus Enterococcus clewellii]|uniref:HNH nuclease domain-containing protein n=1 Tax=Candidatus Enterococcus clewellii TaxID=1834193 RepID=A0A242K7W5_9ENTE|nr:putative HNHc nuclease [Enterococcus sp. 9E7_DIV0242]OTP17264.1 hypothetical protein A5888_001402 [Enterococcus sp. 9E7_DIV0242]
MKLFGKVTKISGKEITLSLDDESDIRRLQTLSDGAQPLIEVNVHDQREIRADQRKMAYAIFEDIAIFTGSPPDIIKGYMKNGFESTTGIEFSLADTTVEVATAFLSYLISFMFEHRIPFRKGFEPLPENTSFYLYSCIRKRVCAVCGKEHADIHHAVNFVGMGNNRRNVNHLKSKFISLCREHHNEIHVRGLTEFMQHHHVAPIKLKSDTLIRLGLMSKKQVEQFEVE